MYGQTVSGRAGNRSRIQNNYQSPRNDKDGEQQNLDPEQGDVKVQPAPPAPQESQTSSPCRIIQPDPSKRERLLRLARKEEEEYERFKESKRPGPIHLPPTILGGQTPEPEVRRQQQRIQAQSKYQKMFKRDEYKRKQKEEEEAQIQEMKDIQRRKAEKLENKRQQEDLERRQRWHEDRYKRNNHFLDRFQPTNNTNDRRFGQLNEWATNQEQDEDWKSEQALKRSHKMGKIEDQAVKQERTMQKMREMESEDEWEPNGAVNQEQDEDDLMLQQALKDSLLTHKIEEQNRLQEIKMPQHKQYTQDPEKNLRNMEKKNNNLSFTENISYKSKHQTYRQQQKEEEERKLKEMKAEQLKKAEALKQHQEQSTLSQEEERRRVNNAFLDRLQRQNTSQNEYSGESNTWA
ncbi:epithelial-stromal interaction protein 1 isoform X1 [Bufo bufo]|uniref:epithelial-stromal interaction protein 1 isoform X1 n=1 Tax=Bufo bufo TaxID=8384 RepID=UPI001ABDD869|nr:epithelial-stromal interaction protein 1 isoform X1 [Bufo bufo]